MSLYGEGIIERLHDKSILHNTGNPMHRIIDDGVGGWLDSFDEDPLSEEVFLESSTGKWLDLHGKDFGVNRITGEDDDSYRERIVYEGLGRLTSNRLAGVYGLTLYCLVEDFSIGDNVLVSDNPYLCSKHMCFADTGLQGLLDKKFVLGQGLTYIDEED